MNRAKQIFCLFLLAFSGALNGSSETADFNFPNKPGNDAVGFRVVLQYDYSRSYRRKVDNMGRPFYGELARPVQTLIWYPAQQSAAAHITYGDYLNLAATQDDFKPSPEQTASALAFAKKQFNASPSAAMWAIADAMPQPGKFPVIIYAASFNAPAFENADLCEYLASHGYIVIASPSIGASSLAGMTDDIEGIEAQAHDISFLVGFARTIPEADCSELAVAGFSWGGYREFFCGCRGYENYCACGIGWLCPLFSETSQRFNIRASF